MYCVKWKEKSKGWKGKEEGGKKESSENSENSEKTRQQKETKTNILKKEE